MTRFGIGIGAAALAIMAAVGGAAVAESDYPRVTVTRFVWNEPLWSLCPRKGGKCGYVDRTGKWVIEPQLEDALSFSEGLALVKLGDKYGYISDDGTWVVKPQFQNMGEADGALLWKIIEDARRNNPADETLGSRKGGPIPDKFGCFQEGLANVRLGGKLGVIDKKGGWVLEPRFDYVGRFLEGQVPVILGGKHGSIDKAGKWVIEPRFDYVGSFSHGLVNVGLGGKYGVMDKSGRWVAEPQFDDVYHYSEGLAVAKLASKYGVIEGTGDWAVKPRFDSIGHYTEGLAVAQLGGKYGVIDKTGEWVVESRFEGAGSFAGGLTWVKLGGKYGYIDKVGKSVIEPRFEDARDFSDGLAVVRFARKYGVISKSGEWILEAKYDEASLDGDLIHVTFGNSSGYVNHYGRPLTFTTDDFVQGIVEANQEKQEAERKEKQEAELKEKQEKERLKTQAAASQPPTSSTQKLEDELKRLEEIDRRALANADAQKTAGMSSDYEPGRGAYVCTTRRPCAVSIVALGGSDKFKVEFTSYCDAGVLDLWVPGFQKWVDRGNLTRAAAGCSK